ncbi:alpha/beta fold hydrolase [Microbacterium sp.]|uniref:alpha/beta fold hydrolase n=1 Tax=Microbacterium sp. TaxID=51671 RepID=UPI003A8C12AD
MTRETVVQTLDLGSAHLAYDLTGDVGPLVVQLHGLTSSRERDALLGLDLGRSLRGHRVLRYDARGHGRSSGSSDSGDYRWDRLAADLLALLDHVAPGETVHGVGASMGAGTLLHAAVADPQRFATLTLLTPPTAWGLRAAKAQHYLAGAALIEAEGIAAYEESGSTAPVPPALADAPATGLAVAEELLPTVLRGAAATDFPSPDHVRGIGVPTLVLAWSQDPTHPLRTARRLSELIPRSELVVARTAYGVMAWPGLFAEHVTTAETPAPVTGAITLPPGGGELTVRILDTAELCVAGAAVLGEVWADRSAVAPQLLRALAHSGNYVAGVFDADRVIGASAAFCAEPTARSMHSHITGVLPSYQSRGVGRMLKQHQRDWALERSLEHITWTFDPLVARNAHFNLSVLGARVSEYLVDHYGALADGVNRGEATDRLLVTWPVAVTGQSTPAEADIVATVPLPPDIESLRRTDPAEAAAWRTRVRARFQELYAEGCVVGGFRDGRGYLFVRG